jgi:hypothetical protein
MQENPLWTLAVLVIGGLMYLVISHSPTSSRPTALAVRRPDWIARRRARGGIAHRRDRVGIGYASATRSVDLSVRELAGHGLAIGGPGSGKTTFLQLVEASAERVPCVIVDPKGSPALEATVRAHGGQVWTLDGRFFPPICWTRGPGRCPRLRTTQRMHAPTVMRPTSGPSGRPGRLLYATSDGFGAQLRRLLDREALLRAWSRTAAVIRASGLARAAEPSAWRH